MSGQKYSHMTPVLHHRGPAGQQWLENEKAPSVTGGAQKILYAAVSRTRKLFGSPAQGGPNKFGAPHTGRLIETEHDNHPKELRTVRNSRALNAMPIAFASYFRQFNLVAHAATAAIHLTLADRTAHDCVPFHNCRGVRPWPEKGTVKRPGNYRRRGCGNVRASAIGRHQPRS